MAMTVLRAKITEPSKTSGASALCIHVTQEGDRQWGGKIESPSAGSMGEFKNIFFINMVPILHVNRI
jgi:hypothetical protein